MKSLPLIASAFCLLLAACDGGQDTPGAKAAQQRHEEFEAIGEAFKGIGDELKKGAPDLVKIRAGAAAINAYAPQVKDWFPAGSGPQDGVKTDALAAIWQQPDDFGKAAARFVEAAAALDTAAQSGDPAAVRGAVGPLGGACKGCHDRFRKED